MRWASAGAPRVVRCPRPPLTDRHYNLGAHMLWGGAIVVQGFLLLALITFIT